MTDEATDREWVESAPSWVSGLAGKAIKLGDVINGTMLEVSGHIVALRIGSVYRRSVVSEGPWISVPASATGESQYYDLGEWVAALDGHEIALHIHGEAQLDALERLEEFVAARGPETTRKLRTVRENWFKGLPKPYLFEEQLPEWPVSVEPAEWMAQLDQHLIDVGFGSGWVVESDPGQPIGVVRERGALRVQLSVLLGEPLVQFAIPSVVCWRTLSNCVEVLEIDAAGEFESALVVLQEFVEAVYDKRFRVLNKGRMWREAEEAGIAGQGVGPYGEREWFEFFPPGYLVDYLHPDDVKCLGDVRWRLPGDSPIELRLADGISYDTLPAGDSNWFVSGEIFDQFEHFVRDSCRVAEFAIDGQRWVQLLLTAPTSPLIDPVRSVDKSGQPSHRVLDPRSLRGSYLVPGLSFWYCDREMRTFLETLTSDFEFLPLWDGKLEGYWLERVMDVRSRLAGLESS